jgi:peptide/nickel transport system permease protein
MSGVRVAVRIIGAAAIVVLSTAAIWVALHVLRPDAFRGGESLTHYLGRAFLHFDLGMSRTLHRPVADVVRDGAPADLQLLLGGVVAGLALGIVGGLYCAARPDGAVAHALHVVAMIGVCTPVYVVGLAALLLFGHGISRVADLGIPLTYTSFGDSPGRWLHSMIVPWLVVGFPLAGAALRMMRAQAVEIRGEDSVRTARAKGLSERSVLRHHLLRPALAPVVTMVGATVNATLLNMVLAERAFSVPGVFQQLTHAMDSGDFSLLFALTIVGAVLVSAGNLAADLVLFMIDPRVRA